MAKFKDAAEAKEALTGLNEELTVAKKEKKDFEKENKLEKGADHSENEKFGKKWTKLNAQVEKKQKAVDEAKEFIANNKPKKEAKERVFKYEYPAGATAAEKKKIRAEARAQAKRDEKAKAKAEAGDTPKKDKKKDKKAEEGIAEKAEKAEKKDKKEKKEKKAEAPAED